MLASDEFLTDLYRFHVEVRELELRALKDRTRPDLAVWVMPERTSVSVGYTFDLAPDRIHYIRQGSGIRFVYTQIVGTVEAPWRTPEADQ